MKISAETTFNVGQENFVDSVSPTNSYAAIFEDDSTTGYFYAIDTKNKTEVLDALHIYNVADVSDKDKPSKIQIFWTDDGLIASLLINDYCHAIFDFDNRAGFCRNSFPKNKSGWAKVENRHLTDELIKELFAARI
ncbi:MAG TPA: DUF2251 domain-containing protein [Parafilimonas sp.]|nr:DUF2251 domain-containing protein [Parafilimonas sp.]